MRWPPHYATPLIALLAAVTTLSAGCSRDPGDPTPGSGGGVGSGRRFTARLELPTRGQPEVVGIRDLTGDGQAELWALTRAAPVSGGRTVGTLHLWSDPFAAPRVVELPDYPVGAVPLRRAGGWWLAIASRSTNELILLDPTAAPEAGGAKPRTVVVPLPGRPRAVAAGPLWSDERWAVACATAAGELLLFDADGALIDTTEIGALLPTLVDVGAGEVSVGCQADRSLRRWILRADGSLPAEPEVVMLDGIPRDLGEADLDGDGSLERVLAGGDDSLWVLGPEGPVARRTGPIPLALARDSGSLFLLTHTDLSYTQFEAGRRVHREYAGQDVWDIAVGDLDQDGHADLAIANRGASRVSLVFGGPAGFLEAERVPTGAGPQRLAIGDLDGDGRAEIVTVNASDEDLSVLSDDGGGYREVRRLSAGHGVDRVCIADVNADGLPDVAYSALGPEGAVLRAHCGDGASLEALGRERIELPLRASLGDLLLGGLLSAVSDPASGRVQILDVTSAVPQITASIDVPHAPVALVALEGEADGAVRLAVAVGGPGPRLGVALWAEGESGWEETGFVPLPLVPVDLVAYDHDGDGHSELAVLARKKTEPDGQGRLVLLREDADERGTWSAFGQAVTGLRSFALAAGDLDGDGRDELVVGAQNSHHVNLFRTVEGGLERLPDLGTGNGVLDVAVFDLDGDGWPEVVSVNGFSNDVSIVRTR